MKRSFWVLTMVAVAYVGIVELNAGVEPATICHVMPWICLN